MQQRIKRVVDLWGPNGSQPSEAEYKDEMEKIRKAIVDFHGEMVLLVNYSNINYTGTIFFYLSFPNIHESTISSSILSRLIGPEIHNF